MLFAKDAGIKFEALSITLWIEPFLALPVIWDYKNG